MLIQKHQEHRSLEVHRPTSIFSQFCSRCCWEDFLRSRYEGCPILDLAGAPQCKTFFAMRLLFSPLHLYLCEVQMRVAEVFTWLLHWIDSDAHFLFGLEIRIALKAKRKRAAKSRRSFCYFLGELWELSFVWSINSKTALKAGALSLKLKKAGTVRKYFWKSCP